MDGFLLIFFYFFAETKRANIQPTNVQPNNHEPHLVRMVSSLERLFAAARYAGANNIHINTHITPAYFNIGKISFHDIIIFRI